MGTGVGHPIHMPLTHLTFGWAAGTTKYIVYKQIHRSLVGAQPYPDLSSRDEKLQHIIEIVLFGEIEATTLHVRCESSTAKDRWLAVFEPKADEEGIYEPWDCPQAQALYDYKSTQPDELDLAAGDIVSIVRRHSDGWCRGFLVDSMPHDGSEPFLG